MLTLQYENALLSSGWAKHVRLQVDDAGDIVQAIAGADKSQSRAGCLLPGVPNLHSHAHQRAMVGRAEHAGATRDDFWTWREAMYRNVARIQPHHLQAIAAQLYVEMLKAGYTSVGEFQYLHHDRDGQRYESIAEMSLRVLAAAREVGIGFTLLPVYYRCSGFGGRAPDPSQRRFTSEPDEFLRIVDALLAVTAGDPNAAVGVAPHSLRAVTKEQLGEILEAVRRPGFLGQCPIHIHVAEQAREVDECLAWCGLRPVEWLFQHFEPNQKWCLVHATHMTDVETQVVAESGAVVGLCPTTEANLGDGFFNADRFLAAGGEFGVGSDSHVSVSPVEELRWLEYGQRLKNRRRNVLVADGGSSTGRTLFERAVGGGARACGRRIGRIEPGYRADLIVLDTESPTLCDRQEDAILDAWIFSGNVGVVSDVFVGGRHVVRRGRCDGDREIAERFRSVMLELSA